METKVSHIETMRAQYKYNVLQVLWLTGMDEFQFGELMLETGLSWMEWHTGDDKGLLALLLKNEIIWNWWRNEWYKRDNECYLKAIYQFDKAERLSRYRQLHQQVFALHSTAQVFLSQSYASAIGEMFDHENNKR